ncbi:MAG: T9SS type A sorting domain-containing protein [Deferribacteres bacterium]|nr:T9SS type A sorting domain-containing protein [Deferribacteres bacterium]
MKKVLQILIIIFLSHPSLQAQQWEYSGLVESNYPVSQIVVAPDSNATIYAISKGLDRSIDGGSTWKTLIDEKCTHVAVDPLHPEILYVSSEGKILKSGDSGGSWSDVSPDMTVYSNSIGHIAIDPVQTDTIYVGIYNRWWPGGFYRSFNGGVSWDSLWAAASIVTIDPVDRHNIFVNKFSSQGLWKSSDFGVNWKTMNTEWATIRGIAIIPEDPKRILIGTYKNGFYLTLDNGNSWEQKNAGLDSLVRIKNMQRVDGQFFVALTILDEFEQYKSSGGYTSPIDTINWKPIGDPDYFKDISAISIAYSRSYDKIFVGTDLGGIYSYTKTSVGIKKDEIENFSRVFLEQNYPNPVNQNTTIRYSIPISGNVKLRVFDVRGREIATLVNRMQETGSYVVGFNTTGLPNGIYFYKFQTDGFVQTKKMMLIR